PPPAAEFTTQLHSPVPPPDAMAENAPLPWEVQSEEPSTDWDALPTPTQVDPAYQESATWAVEESPELQPTPSDVSSTEEDFYLDRDATNVPAEVADLPAENIPVAASLPGLLVERSAPSRREKENTLTYGMFFQLTGSKPFIDVLVEHRLPAD